MDTAVKALLALHKYILYLVMFNLDSTDRAIVVGVCVCRCVQRHPIACFVAWEQAWNSRKPPIPPKRILFFCE